MKNFFNKNNSGDRKNNSRDSKFGGPRGGSKFGGPRGGSKFGGPRGGKPPMHPATCDQCHSPCEVPFRPTGQQPVLCFECFRRKEGRDTRPRSGGQRFDRTDRYEKPSFRSAPRGHDDDVARQLKALNEKMDMIIEALSQDPDADGDDDELSFE